MTTAHRKNGKALGCNDFILKEEKFGAKPFPVEDSFYQGLLLKAVKQVNSKITAGR